MALATSYSKSAGAAHPRAAVAAPGNAAIVKVRRTVEALAVIYFVALLACWCALALGADRFWWATLVAFGPRWLALTPLLLLLPALVAVRRRYWLLTCGSVLIALFPIMGLAVSPASLLPQTSDASALRIVSCNVAGAADKIDFAVWPFSEADVVALQECPAEAALHAPPDWHVCRIPGLAVVSRHKIVNQTSLEKSMGVWSVNRALHCRIAAPWGEFDLATLHLTTPREGIESVIQQGWKGATDLNNVTAERSNESRWVCDWINVVATAPGGLVIAGDFNMPSDSRIFRRDWAGYQNAFACAGLGLGHTKLTRWFGVRIDHVLASSRWRVAECAVGSTAPADHLPVYAKLHYNNGDSRPIQ